MYIGGGAAPRRQLRAVPGQGVRPTSSRVRQALFNVLRGVIADAMFVDLFAGTGSVGLEALSHGARQAVFVECAAPALQVLRTNLRCCAMTARATVLAGTLPQALGKLSAYGPVEFIFLDPPYASDLGEQTLMAISEARLLAPHGMVVWQHTACRPAPAGISGPSPHRRGNGCAQPLVLWQSRRYGDTRLSFYTVLGDNPDGVEHEHTGEAATHEPGTCC
jgi:16S rRNA (guanine(966)-N(2))-methyltransferase RsmD